MPRFEFVKFNTISCVIIHGPEWDLLYKKGLEEFVFLLNDDHFGGSKPNLFEKAMRSLKKAYFINLNKIFIYDRFEIYHEDHSIILSCRLPVTLEKTARSSITFNSLPFSSRVENQKIAVRDFLSISVNFQDKIRSLEDKIFNIDQA